MHNNGDLIAAFRAIENEFEGTLEYDTPRAKYAYYRIGGTAAVIATPRTFSALVALHSVLRKTAAPFFVLGWGSNLLFSDERFSGVVIRMKHLFTEIEKLGELNCRAGNFLKLGASLGAASLLKKASDEGLGGLSFLTGIPGSVGGMVAMNAGTHLGEIGKRLIQTETVNLTDAALTVQTHSAIVFKYPWSGAALAGFANTASAADIFT